ncbi:MAG: hypothetical protein ACK5Y6_01115 [Pseudomonadota bacterium]|jgi:hypothetical protein
MTELTEIPLVDPLRSSLAALLVSPQMPQKLKLPRKAPDSQYMDELFSVGTQGLNNGFQRASEASQRLIRSFSAESEDDSVQAIIDITTASREVEAAANIIRTANDLNRYILDLWA